MAYPYYPYSPNYFSSPYQQLPMQQPQQAMQTPSVQPQMPYSTSFSASSGASSLIWVKGRNEADAYPVAPNGAVALWDMENPCIYLKKADPSGKPTITVYDLVERTDKPIQTEQPVYASKDDLAAFRGDLDGMKNEIKRMQDDLYGLAGKRGKNAKEVDEK